MQIKAIVAFFLGSAWAATNGAKYPPFYGTGWGGPVRFADNYNISSNTTGFTMVEATLVMPHLSIPKKPHEKTTQYTASYWIGLDGYFSSEIIRGLWQAGVIMSVWPNGTTEYTGFHEWIPDDPISISFADLAISEGDHVHVVMKTTNNGYRGSTSLTNLNTSQTYLHSQDAPTAWRGPTFPSQGASAEWIIEAGTYLNGPQYILPDWGTATFFNARACTKKGKCALPGGNKDQGSMTAVFWNDTKTLYTRSCVEKDRVSIEYIEEHFTPKV
ncbi:concanavalin A-like lectin/glucanase domain-containing protein [Ilyonectria sp. MPI-CAGE-AT-0026]|nr:concanavalin A-like lectin/glucanase domain-containing protein [Ilyonectria sp. MPI-CAGE-AT-0026]